MAEESKKIAKVNRGQLIAEIEQDNLKMLEEEQKKSAKKSKKKDERYEFGVGDSIKVWSKIIEGQGKKMKERLQGFEGIVISIKGRGISKSFTVRKISYKIGVERVFLFSSPKIDRVEITKKGKVRRAKLYYLRDRVGKAAQVKRKDMRRKVKKS